MDANERRMAGKAPSAAGHASTPPESSAFADGVKRLVSIPKEEIERREAEWRKQRDEKRRPKDAGQHA